jgi:hypothetical protein
MRLLDRVFAERRKRGGIDLEAVEMAIRAALHCAGAAALGQLLHYGPPAVDQRWLPCVCGQQAQYPADQAGVNGAGTHPHRAALLLVPELPPRPIPRGIENWMSRVRNSPRGSVG